ncbi:MAG: PAS domain-containing protein, partial [Mycobacteriaceae bacterium]
MDEISGYSQALAANEAAMALLRAAADAMLDPQVLLQAVRCRDGLVVDLVVRSVNRATCLFTREREEDLLDRSAVAMLPNLRGSGLIGRIAQCLEDGKPVIVEDFKVFTTVLDDFRLYDMRATRAGVDLIVFTWRDVTQRFQDLDRIAASEERYRLLVENSGDVIVHTRECDDGGNEIVWVSPNVAEVLGAPAEHWLGRRLSELFAPEDAQAHAARWKKVSEGAVIKERVRFKSADDVAHWFHVRIKPFHDAEGHRDGAVTSIRPGDHEVVAEQALEEARRQQAKSDERYRRSM